MRLNKRSRRQSDMEILEMKNTITETKNPLDGLNNPAKEIQDSMNLMLNNKTSSI